MFKDTPIVKLPTSFACLLKPSILILSVVFLLTACSASKPDTNYTQRSLKAAQQFSGVALSESQAQHLVARFIKHFNAAQTSHSDLEDLYAAEFYFNDTLIEINRRAQLDTYMQQLNERAQDLSVELLDYWHAEAQVYIRWRMQFKLNLWGRKKHLASIGMTQLHANKQQQIVYHQDYWDANNGLYRQLPFAAKLYQFLTPLKHPKSSTSPARSQ